MAFAQTYVTLDEDAVIDDMIEESLGTETSYRTSIDGTKAILKFNVKHPNTMSGKTKYTHTEFLQYLSDNSVTWEAAGP